MNETLLTASGAVGFLLPALVAVVVRSSWSSWLKGLVVVASSIAAGAVTAFASGGLTGQTWLQSAMTIGVAALAAYKLWWQPTGIGPAIERATQPASATPGTAEWVEAEVAKNAARK